MLEKWDLVKIIAADDEYREFIGQEGIIVKVCEKWEYPYSVVFFNKEYRKITKNVLWKNEYLEGI